VLIVLIKIKSKYSFEAGSKGTENLAINQKDPLTGAVNQFEVI